METLCWAILVEAEGWLTGGRPTDGDENEYDKLTAAVVGGAAVAVGVGVGVVVAGGDVVDVAGGGPAAAGVPELSGRGSGREATASRTSTVAIPAAPISAPPHTSG